MILDINGVKSVASSGEITACAVYIYDDIRIVDQRLYDRYLGSNPTAEGLKRYVSRKEQNNADFLAAGEFAKDFYYFLKNSEAPSDSAEELFAIFTSYVEGNERNEEKILFDVDSMLSSLRAAYN